MRVFKSRVFAQFCRKNDIGDDALRELIHAMTLGAIDADLGGGVYKQRLRRKGQGKSGGYRTIILFRFGRIALFAFGFAKKDTANIERADLMRFRKLAREVLNYDDKELDQTVRDQIFEEIDLEEEPLPLKDRGGRS